jgi:exodeoxyribonuclease VII small subunit
MADANDDQGQGNAPTTFRDAYAVLQNHAETLRSQQEPNIDELVNIVTQSVEAYRVCKARIDAVEKALERTLSEAENAEAAAPAEGRAESAGASPGNSSARKAQAMGADDHGPDSSAAPRNKGRPARSVDDFDEDIPF